MIVAAERTNGTEGTDSANGTIGAQPVPVSDHGKMLLVDFECFKIPDRMKTTAKEFFENVREQHPDWLDDSLWKFFQTVLESSGISKNTHVSDAVLAVACGKENSKPTIKDCLAEAREVLFDTVGHLLERTGIPASEIDIVMVSSTCFTPVPSMAAMIVNKFKIRSDALTYNMAGMGCASSLSCVDLAKHLLKAAPNRRALIVSHENTSANLYMGKERSMLLTNAIFRIGGSAVLVSNRPEDLPMAKYELVCSQRTNHSSRDEAFNCMGIAQDSDGIRGIFLQKSVPEAVHHIVLDNADGIAAQAFPSKNRGDAVVTMRDNIQHFLLHCGGKRILNVVQDTLGLTAAQVKDSTATLFHFGNTAMASTWYIMARAEAAHGVKEGDLVWQLAYGGTLDCDSAVWKAIKTIKEPHACWSHHLAS